MTKNDRILYLLLQGYGIGKIIRKLGDVTYAEVKTVKDNAVRRFGRDASGRLSVGKENHLGKCARRAAQLGMSYGVYMASLHYAADVRSGYYEGNNGKKKTVTAATVHGNKNI